MPSWGAFEKALDKVGAHSNLIGKYWITTFNMIRLLFLFTIGSSAWPDGASLECDTNVPGCVKMCVNKFYPIAPITFWSLQVLFVCLPVVVFMVYADHMQGKIKFALKIRAAIRNDAKLKIIQNLDNQKKHISTEKTRLTQRKVPLDDEFDLPDGSRRSNEDALRWFDEEEERIKNEEEQMDREVKAMIKTEEEEDKKAISATGSASTPPKFLLAYAHMVLFRLLIEVFFVWLYYQLYEFEFIMPEKYFCDEQPCNNVVACFIDRPKQKTFTIIFLMASMLFTIMMGLVELSSIGITKYFKAFQNRHKDITKEYNVAVAAIYAAYSKEASRVTADDLRETSPEHNGM